MTIKDQSNLACLLCEYFVRPVKEFGVDHEVLAENAMRFIQEFLRKEKGVAEMISHFEVEGNINAGGQFLDELNIKY